MEASWHMSSWGTITLKNECSNTFRKPTFRTNANVSLTKQYHIAHPPRVTWGQRKRKWSVQNLTYFWYMLSNSNCDDNMFRSTNKWLFLLLQHFEISLNNLKKLLKKTIICEIQTPRARRCSQRQHAFVSHILGVSLQTKNVEIFHIQHFGFMQNRDNWRKLLISSMIFSLPWSE